MKKKILSLAMIVCMLSIAIVGGTLAYFTDNDSATNTFTVGDVEIDLTEAVVEADDDGNLVAKGEERQDVLDDEEAVYDYGKLYPAQYVTKDPKIENLGSEDAYVAAKVTVKSEGDLYAILGAAGYDILALDEIISGGVVTDTFKQGALEQNQALYGNFYEGGDFVYQEVKDVEGVKEYVLYFFIKDALAGIDEENDVIDSVTLFEKISIPEGWTNDQMANLKGLEIKVDAYAVQAYGFHNCYDAITAAFPTDFAF